MDGRFRPAATSDRAVRVRAPEPQDVHSKESHELIAELGELIAAGEVTPVIDRVYQLDAAPAAIAQLASGQLRGKAVVRIKGAT